MAPELTELEQLARMVGNPDLEPLDTASLIADSLKAKLGGVSPDRVREMEDEIRNSGNVVESSRLKKIQTTQTTQSGSMVATASSEKLLMALYQIREGVVEAFETCNINTPTARMLSSQINKIASCIRYMGGEVEEFEPLNHVSGLTSPNFYKNAQKVIETTMQCYSLGEIEDAKVLENGKKITITFTGNAGNVYYRAAGRITSDEWTGNEAIDYIYTPGEGKMSVKAFENGRWIDRSSDRNSDGKYKVVWELEETELSQAPEKRPLNQKASSETPTETTAEAVEEETPVVPNTIPEDYEDDLK
jgi:hypothetical protein